MSKEKNKNTFRIGALLLVACLISSVMLSGTFAKYTSEYAGQDTALVARWDFVATGGQSDDLTALGEEAVSLNLFKHLYDTQITQSVVVGEKTRYIIAPGVSGNFVLNLTNNSDVAADITFDITEADGNPSNPRIPMEFSIFDNFVTTDKILNGVDALENALNIEAIHLGHTDGNANRTVYWRWAYNGATATADATDITDTTLGTNSNASYNDGAGTRDSYTLTIKVTATQAAPGPANFTMDPISVEGTNLTVGSLSGGNANYQWQIGDSINGTYSNIATGATYSATADSGKYIRVIATGTGENRGTVTSDPVAIP